MAPLSLLQTLGALLRRKASAMSHVELFAGLSGRLLAKVPTECVRDCSASGPVDDACAYWARHASVTFGSPDDIRADLKELGAWEPEELADDDANRERILFTACGAYAEELRQGEEA